MKKNKNKFLRRCGSVIAAAVVLLCCLAPMMAAPASASVGSSVSRNGYYTPLRFDYIFAENRSSGSKWWVRWDFNEFSPLAGGVDPSYKIVTKNGSTGFGYEGSTEFIGVQNQIVSSITLSHDISKLANVTLVADELVLHRDDFDSPYCISVGPEFSNHFLVILRFDYVWTEQVNDEYIVRTEHLEKGFSGSSDDAYPLNLMDCISQLLRRVTGYNPSARDPFSVEYILLRNLQVCIQDPTPGDGFVSGNLLTLRSHLIPASVSSPSGIEGLYFDYPSISDWIESQGISAALHTTVVSFPSLTDWIVTAVAGFLDAKLIPGFSFGALLSFIIGLGVAVVFIKVFSG